MIYQSTNLTKELVEMAALNGTLDDIYGQEVNRLIRLRYTQSQENAIYRHKLNGSDNGEFAIFDAYCEECKVVARENINALKQN
jgi:hypothetical protein